MSEVQLAFRDRFRDAMLAGRKTMTTRRHRAGQPGDTFTAFGETFTIIGVRSLYVGVVAADYWEREGVASADEFIAIWRELHPEAGWRPLERVIVHEFRRVGA